jgi:WD40 repeat protein
MQAQFHRSAEPVFAEHVFLERRIRQTYARIKELEDQQRLAHDTPEEQGNGHSLLTRQHEFITIDLKRYMRLCQMRRQPIADDIAAIAVMMGMDQPASDAPPPQNPAADTADPPPPSGKTPRIILSIVVGVCLIIAIAIGFAKTSGTWPFTREQPEVAPIIPPPNAILTDNTGAGRVGRLITINTEHQVHAVAWHPNSKMMAVALEGGKVDMYDRTLQVTRPGSGDVVTKYYPLRAESPVLSMAFHPHGNKLATGLENGTVKVWRVSNGAQVDNPIHHTKPVNSVAFSPDGALLASASSDGTVKVCHVDDGTLLHTLDGDPDGMTSVAFTLRNNDIIIASGAADGTVRVWNVENGHPLYILEGHESPVTSVAFRPDGETLASGFEDGVVDLWQMSNDPPIPMQTITTAPVNSLAFSPDGTMLASASTDGTVSLWREANGAYLLTLGGHEAQVNNVAFSPDGTMLASVSPDRTVRLWGVVVPQ